VNGTPALPITLNSGGPASAAYVSGSGSASLLFRYTVAAGQRDADGISLGTALSLNGGSITSLDDGAPVSAALTLPAGESSAGLRVDGINDAPSLSTNLPGAAYRENDPAIMANPAISLGDSDSPQLSGATVTISAGFTAGDLLALPSGVAGGISASFSNSGVLTLSGDAPLSTYQSALRAITFSSSSDHPTAISNSRTLTWQVTDKDSNPANQASSTAVTTMINLTAVNDNPRLAVLAQPVASGTEDSPVEISLQTLLAEANASDADGTVDGFVVQAISSGSLRLGSTAGSATAWAAGSNAVIDASTKAWWTPAANANGTGSNALAAFTVVARDTSGALSSTARTVAVSVAPDQSDAARITDLVLPPGGTYAIDDTLQLKLRLDRAVTVGSGDRPSLRLQLANGRSVDALLKAGTSGTIAAGTALVFSYVVQPGDLSSSGGIGLPASLSLPASTSLTNLDDNISLSADAALPQPLPNSSAIALDGVSPVVATIAAAPGNQANAANQNLRISFTEPVQRVDPSHFTIGSNGTASGRVVSLLPVNPSNGLAQAFDLAISDLSGSGNLRIALKPNVTSIRDGAGNAIASGLSTGGDLVVDRDAPPAPSIDGVGDDDLISLAEATNSSGLTIEGGTSHVEAGQLLALTVAGTTISSTTTIGSNGRWQATLTAAQLATLGDGTHTLNATVSDAAGNPAPLAARSFRIDRLITLSDPTLDATANPALQDGRLNASETVAGLTIAGSSDAEDGQTLLLTLGSIETTAIVSSGQWKVELSSDQLAALPDGAIPLTLVLADQTGNSSRIDHTLVLDRLAQANLTPLATDGWINGNETSQPLLLNALLDGVEDGRSFTFTLTRADQSQTTYTASVNNGQLALAIPATELGWNDGTSATIALSGSDLAGNAVASTRTIQVDLTPPTLTPQLQRGSEDAIDLSAYGPGGSRANQPLNAADFAAGLWISSAASDDAMVTVVDAGRTGGLLVAPSNGRWRLALDPDRFAAPNEGTLPLTITVVDGAGNSATSTASLPIDRAAVISVDAPVDGPVGNDQINAAEAPRLLIAGRVQQVQTGASITVAVSPSTGGTSVWSGTTAVQADGRWQLDADASAWSDGTYDVRASVVDSAGNPATTTRTIVKNTRQPIASLIALAGDNTLNAGEITAAVPPSLAGIVDNVDDGQSVSVTLPGAGTIAGRTLSTVVEGGLWNLPIPADLLAAYGTANSGGTLSYQVSNAAGNSASGTLAFQVDTQAPVLSLAPVAAERWAAAAADGSANPITLSGTVQGLEVGRSLQLSLNGRSLPVARSSANPDNWSLQLPTSWLAGLRASGNRLTLAATDQAGNSATVDASFEIPSIDTTPPTILLPQDRTYTIAEGNLLIGMLKADRPVTWSLLDADPSLAINATTGGLAFNRPITLADSDEEGNALGDQQLELVVVASDARNNQSFESISVVVINTPDPAPDVLDQDGVAASVEDAASNGRSTPGDLNNDGIADSLQPHVAAVPWISRENFQAAQADPFAAIPNSFAALQSSSDVRIDNVAVRKPEELAVAGNGSSALPALIGERAIQTPYDTLSFRLTSYDPNTLQPFDQFVDLAPALADGSDPYPGVQVRQQIDLPAGGLAINSYLKWNPAANQGAGAWYEFLADGDPTTYDNGAEMIDLDGDGRIDRILLTYTDGDTTGGDIDGLVNGIIDDPGTPALLTPATVVANDGDGADDSFEDGKDGNRDGIDDALQSLVATFGAASGATVTIAAHHLEQSSQLDPGSQGRLSATTRLQAMDTRGISVTPGDLEASIGQGVLGVSDLVGFTLSTQTSVRGAVDPALLQAYQNQVDQRFQDSRQQIDVYFADGNPDRPWNSLLKPNGKGGYFLFDYNPATGLGTILLDRDANGRVDGARLYLQDGELGDLDGDRNGAIDDPIALVSLRTTPTLQRSADGQGLRVDGVAGSGLWLNLQALGSDALWQNTLELISSAGVRLGALGVTTDGTHLGNSEVYVAAGQELRFVQVSRNDERNTTPDLQIEAVDGGFRVGLDDGGGNKDRDYNDLQVQVSSSLASRDADALAMARLQRDSADAILDLTGVPVTGARLKLTITADSGYTNSFGLVRLELDPLTGQYSVDGVSASNSDAFRTALVDNLIHPGGSPITAGGQVRERTVSWALTGADAGIYGAVLINPNGQVFSFGASAADGQQHVKLMGANHFNFEDLLASEKPDWDFNDFSVVATWA
jgi:hypothetical protein